MSRRRFTHRRSRSVQSGVADDSNKHQGAFAIPLSPLSPSGERLSSISEEPGPAGTVSSRAVASLLSSRIAKLTEELQSLHQQWEQLHCTNTESYNSSCLQENESDLSEAHRVISQTYDEIMRTTQKLRESLLSPAPSERLLNATCAQNLSRTPTPGVRARRLHRRSASISVFNTDQIVKDSNTHMQAPVAINLQHERQVLTEAKRLCERVLNEPRNIMRQIAVLQHVCFNSSAVLNSTFLPFSSGSCSHNNAKETRPETFSARWLAEAKPRRNAKSRQLHHALQQLEKCIEHTHHILQHTRVLCVEPAEFTSSDSHFIQFAFPGFEAYTAHVGTIAVVPVVGAFANPGSSQSLWQSQKAYDDNESIAKELMLTIPEQREAAALHMSVCLLNLVLAQYLHSHLSTLQHALSEPTANGQTWTFTFGDVVNALIKERKAGQKSIANERLLREHACHRICVNPTVHDVLKPDAPSDCYVVPPLRFLHVLRDIAIRRLEALGAVQEAVLACRRGRRRSSAGFHNGAKPQLLARIAESVRYERQQLNLTLQCLSSIELDDLSRHVQLHSRAVVAEQACPTAAFLAPGHRTPSPMSCLSRRITTKGSDNTAHNALFPPLFPLEERISPSPTSIQSTPGSELLSLKQLSSPTSPCLRLHIRKSRKAPTSEPIVSRKLSPCWHHSDTENDEGAGIVIDVIDVDLEDSDQATVSPNDPVVAVDSGVKTESEN
ncbi:MAG: hypothetical protein MHM6MM_003726 [Cercozoa sp. M6MM]